jgi:hypothetical protein
MLFAHFYPLFVCFNFILFTFCFFKIGTATWEKQECGGQVPPPMIGHTVVLHQNKIVVIGGWADKRWACDTIYKLHRSMQ